MSGVNESAISRVTEALAAIDAVDRPEIWIKVRNRKDLLGDAAQIDAAAGGGADVPLAGLRLAGQSKVDVAGVAGTDKLCGGDWSVGGPPHNYGQVIHSGTDPGYFRVMVYSVPTRRIVSARRSPSSHAGTVSASPRSSNQSISRMPGAPSRSPDG